MSQAIKAARQESSGFRMYLLAAYYLLTRSMSLSTAFFGFVLIIFGFTFAPESKNIFGIPLPTSVLINDVFGLVGLQGVWPSHKLMSPMLVTWGGTLVFLGVSVFALLRVNRWYGKTFKA